MTNKAVEKQQWVIDTLGISPSDRLLEIGCGHGIAVSLLCNQLTEGAITAIDRSDKMIQGATRKNSACVKQGKATFYTVALRDADLQEAPFDKIFAVNVNLFWIDAEQELNILHNWLAPKGRLYLFYLPLLEGQKHTLAEKVVQMLATHHFTVDKCIEVTEPLHALCVITHPNGSQPYI